MKCIIYIIIAVFFAQEMQAQNLIANPSFETPKVANDCPSNDAQFDKLANWSSRVQIVSGYAFHSPDWLKVGCHNQDAYGHTAVPYSGNGVAFATSEELAQQNLSAALNEGLYVFKAQVKIFPASTIYNFDPDHNYYFRLRLSYNEMKYESETNLNDGLTCSADYRKLNGENMLTFLIPIQKTSAFLSNWQQIMLENIKIFNFGYDWLGFDMVVFDENGSERICEQIGIQVDDVELFKDCCGDYILYQNASSVIPNNTQRREYIRAGENVGAPNMTTGPVTITTGRYVKFRAGEYIDLQPGFNQEPGSVFIAEVAPCGSESDGNLDFDISFDYANQCAALNCSEPYYPPSAGCVSAAINAAFYSNGGGWYWVQIRNSSSAVIFEDIQPIHSLIQQYWNGTNSSVFTALNGQALVDITIFNCLNYKNEPFTLTYEYLSGCTPTSKKEDSTLSEQNTDDKFYVKVFPNPATDVLNIETADMVELERNGLEFELVNNVSAIVNKGTTYGNLNISLLSGGLYNLKVLTQNGRVFTFKIVKL